MHAISKTKVKSREHVTLCVCAHVCVYLCVCDYKYIIYNLIVSYVSN